MLLRSMWMIWLDEREGYSVTIQQLKCLCEAVKCENFSTAAESLYLSQSTVSRNILALEESMGLKLMERRGRSSTLTEDGRKVMPYIWDMMLAYDNLQEVVEDMHTISSANSKNTVKLFSIPSIDEMGLIPQIGDFMQENANQLINLTVMEERMAIAALTARNCDMVFCSDTALDRRVFYTRVVRKIKFAIFVAKNHPLASRDEVHLRDIKDYAMVTPARETMLLSLCINACKAAGFTPNVALTTTRPGIAKGFIKNGRNISMGIDVGDPTFDSAQYKRIVLLDSPTFNYVFAWRKDAPLNDSIYSFLDEVCGDEPASDG